VASAVVWVSLTVPISNLSERCETGGAGWRHVAEIVPNRVVCSPGPQDRRPG